ncbi:hypothetical protein ACPB8Q_03115 [Methanocaldococcus indicus]|uniref:hypothetical protein n=1 Tax=Methanocaldococcus indicus TaxID=213231 RepID=UPI003C6D3D96
MDIDNFIDFKKSFNSLELSNETIKIIEEHNIKFSEIAIGEFSGRDSAAAIIKAIENYNIDVVLPIVGFTGTDYGDINIFYKNWETTYKRMREINKDSILLPLHFMFEPELWHALNGRWIALLIKKYGFYTPCIGCHSYLRILRIPLARQLGNKIICGERLFHDNDFKIDQTEEVLTAYKKICEEFNINLLMPIVNIKEGKKIKEIVGEDWEQGKKQFSCVFSKNYRDVDGKVIYEKDKVVKFLNEYIIPSSIDIVKEGYKGNFNYIEITKNYII